MRRLIGSSSGFLFLSQNGNDLLEIRPDGSVASIATFPSPICVLAADPSTNHVAVGIEKQSDRARHTLFVYTVSPADGSLTELFRFLLPHDATQLEFADYNSVFSLLALNSGDLDCISLATHESTTLLGSIVAGTSFALSPSRQFILNADRDARIRVSCYPKTYNIHSFALLHEVFVSSLAWLDDSSFISSDGDGQLAKWDISGRPVLVKKIHANIIRQIALFAGSLIVAIDGEDSLFVVSLADFAVERRIPLGSQPVSIHVAPDGALWALAIGGLFRVGQDAELVVGAPLVGEFSLDEYMVKTKTIIRKDKRGTEEYAVWRDAELGCSKES
jgi:WD40 repeat protein